MLRSQLVITIPLFPLFPVYFLAPNIASGFPGLGNLYQAKQSLPSALQTRLGLVQPLPPGGRAIVPGMTANENLGVWHHVTMETIIATRSGGVGERGET